MTVSGEVVAKNSSFHWKVDLASFDNTEVGDCLLSPIFSFSRSNISNEIWQLLLYPKGDTKQADDYFSLFLKLVNNFENEITTQSSFKLLNEINEEVHCLEREIIFKPGQNNLGVRKFFQRTSLQDPKNNILKNNKFSILFKMISVEKNSTENSMEFQSESRVEESDRFKRLFTSQEFSDVTVTADGRNFFLHKCLLATSSDVFQAMFTTDMIEKNQNTVEITDIRCEILEELFRFIYTGKVNDIKKEKVCELLSAAEKYCVKGLKTLCEKKICDNISMLNVIEYLELALMNNAEQLKTNTIKFISLNLDKLIEKKEFDDFGKQNPEILIKIMKEYIK